jgi:uncharacterized protein (DUF305 family)
MRHRPATLVAAFAAVLAVGCSGSAVQPAADTPRVIQPGAPGEPNRVLTEEEVAELDLEVEHTEADVRFMQGMILHHVQALRMTRMVPSRSAREDVPLFAERMDLSQEDEIALMRRWLEERDEDVPSLLAAHEHGDDATAEEGELMPGMLTEEQLAELEAAEGEAFDRLFLESMLQHHHGALAMVEELFAEGGGEEPEIYRFAVHVEGDQRIEIARMEAMLAELDAG